MSDLVDFHIFYDAARCYLAGIDPYTCDFFYPFPALFIFIPLAVWPYPVAQALWLLINISILVVLFRRKALWFILFTPILDLLFTGQNDLLFLAAAVSNTGIGLAILTLKPQLILLYLFPWFFFWSSKIQRIQFLITSLLLWALSFIAWPGWILAYQGKSYDEAIVKGASVWGSNLPLSILVITVIVTIALTKFKPIRVWVGTLGINPFVNIYDYSLMLIKPEWWLVPLSWGVHILANIVGDSYVYAALPVVYLLLSQHTKKS